MHGLTIDHLFFIFKGAGWTIVLSALGFVGGTILGVPIALARSSRNKWISKSVGIVVQVIQGIPLPIIMFVVYFGISVAGFDLPALVAAGLALTAYAGAYLGEIWKGCIQAVPRTQWEAADCLALTPVQTATHVILPQAFRIAIPPTVGFLVQIVKNSSYAVVIGFFDLTYSSRVVNNSTFEPFLVFSIAAVMYFAMCYPLSRLASSLERKFKKS
ncbi:MAG: amino acid transporter permease [Burkholderia sp.]|nr:amino acid transporter permease [Burkholderia sp.]